MHKVGCYATINGDENEKSTGGYFDRGSSQIEKRDGNQVYVEARAYVSLD